MARLYSNEQFPLGVVDGLRGLGYDVLTVKEAENAGQRIPDDQVLDFATSQQRAVVTLDRRDFIRLHKTRPSHSGIIVCHYDPDHAAFALRIHQMIAPFSDLSGRLLRVNRPSRNSTP